MLVQENFIISIIKMHAIYIVRPRKLAQLWPSFLPVK